MSIRQLNLVWEHSKQRGGALLIMLAIADFADDRGEAYPSVTTLANKGRMSERNARYVLRELEASGELAIEPNAGPKGCHLYRIRLTPNLELFAAKGEKTAPGAKAAPGATGDTKGGKTRQKGGQPIAPEPSLTVKEPSGIYAPSPAVLDWAKKRGYTPWLELHLEHFRDYIAQPKNRKRYSDLDAAFRSCVRADWGDVRKNAQIAGKHGGPTGVVLPEAPKEMERRCCWPKRDAADRCATTTGLTWVGGGICFCEPHLGNYLDTTRKQPARASA